MQEVLLAITLCILFGLGYFFIKKLDYFLVENRKSIKTENKNCEPSYIVLTYDLSDEEIINEIRRFQLKHKNTKILVCNDIDVIKETC